MELRIERWTAEHPRWRTAWQVVEALDQVDWMNAVFAWHRSNHVLVACTDAQVYGFLRFVVQNIGLEDDHDPAMLTGTTLTEAKVLAFGVPTSPPQPGHRSCIATPCAGCGA